MLIFYDTETSSRDLLGQILSYAFIAVDQDSVIQEECCGFIRLNRTQCPEPEAIQVNQLNLDWLQKNGEPEYRAADKIFSFLNKHASRPEGATLVGFNSNQFDLQFVRNLLIRYGLNPYFGGRLKNSDVLHFTRHLAITHPDEFPWQVDKDGKFYTFRLETLAKVWGILDEDQSHDARADALLTIKLVQKLETQFGLPLRQFNPFQIQFDEGYQGQELAKQWQIATPDPQHKCKPVYWMPLFKEGKNALLVNLSAYENNPRILENLKYINQNKHYFHLYPLSLGEETALIPIAKRARDEFSALDVHSLSEYFKKYPKNWDVEYQIHQMGFKHIDTLRLLILKLIKNPDSYFELIGKLTTQWQKWAPDSEGFMKDKYLIQLFNRAYLNLHPDPHPQLLCRYLTPRYITGNLVKDKNEFTSFSENMKKLTERSCLDDDEVTSSLRVYYQQFSLLLKKC